MKSVEEEIKERLQKIETEEQVKIVYAVESGSRAWGFPSANSDYDVRFIYIHHRDFYLSITTDDKRDVIERSILDDYDINGWEIRKALKLFLKSNPPLYEWLGSPIVYWDRFKFAQKLRSLSVLFHSPVRMGNHYYQMAKGNHREYLLGDSPRTKKYFYVIRPLLAFRWLEQFQTTPPTDFNLLLPLIMADQELLMTIQNLIEIKKSGQEMEAGPRIPILDRFIESELQRIQNWQGIEEKKPQEIDPLNQLFRSTLEKAW